MPQSSLDSLPQMVTSLTTEVLSNSQVFYLELKQSLILLFKADEHFLRLTAGMTPNNRELAARELNAILQSHATPATKFYEDLMNERCLIIIQSSSGKKIEVRGKNWTSQ